jgi:hypothetical protein
MLTYIFIAIAASFNAVMDTLWTKFPTSVFKDLNYKWWNPNESWKHYPNFLGIVRLDAWHIAKYGMLGGITLAIMTYSTVHLYDIILIPCIWSVFFELFYSYALKSKK